MRSPQAMTSSSLEMLEEKHMISFGAISPTGMLCIMIKLACSIAITCSWDYLRSYSSGEQSVLLNPQAINIQVLSM